MTTTFKNQIKKDDLSVMEELLHQANYQISDLEAICRAEIFGYDVELEVYPPGESYPSYFRIHLYLFSELVEEWFSDNDIYRDLTTGWFPKFHRDEFKEGGVLYWYKELASDKAQIEVTNYVIKQLFTQIF
jgi:hypothetical protein